MENQKPQIPFTEKLKSIPGFFGIHLNETPKYKVLKEEKLAESVLQFREYEPLLIAKTTVHGSHQDAMEEAFKKLAGYIFGQNTAEKKMAMTSPVLQQEEHKISLSSPMYETHSDGLTMSFILPSDIHAASAPLPTDPTVHIQEVPAQTWAVVQYAGKNTPEDIAQKTAELKKWLEASQHNVDLSTLRVAQYDAPSTIPFLRTNEVQIRLWSGEIH